jgi:YD repeat-containing protein
LNVTTYAYDSDGEVISETDPGGTTKYTYDSGGDLLTQTDPLLNVTSYTYDALGQVIDVTDPVTPKGTTSFTYLPAPEPSSLLLLCAGLLCIVALSARSKRLT